MKWIHLGKYWDKQQALVNTQVLSGSINCAKFDCVTSYWFLKASAAWGLLHSHLSLKAPVRVGRLLIAWHIKPGVVALIDTQSEYNHRTAVSFPKKWVCVLTYLIHIPLNVPPYMQFMHVIFDP